MVKQHGCLRFCYNILRNKDTYLTISPWKPNVHNVIVWRKLDIEIAMNKFVIFIWYHHIVTTFQNFFNSLPLEHQRLSDSPFSFKKYFKKRLQNKRWKKDFFLYTVLNSLLMTKVSVVFLWLMSLSVFRNTFLLSLIILVLKFYRFRSWTLSTHCCNILMYFQKRMSMN